MKTTARQVHDLASYLDLIGKPEAPIHAQGTRRHLAKDFKPKKRGGPLFAGAHELVLSDKPAPETPLPQLDLPGLELA